ncbi:unnamed protein product, partial [Effrenium voratum]
AVCAQTNGVGKSHYIYKKISELQAEHENKPLLHHVEIRETTDISALVSNLLSDPTDPATPTAVHINLAHILPSHVDTLLFELLIVGMLRDTHHSKVYHRRAKKDFFFIEIPNTPGENTAKQLSFCLILPRIFLQMGRDQIDEEMPVLKEEAQGLKITFVKNELLELVGKTLAAMNKMAFDPKSRNFDVTWTGNKATPVPVQDTYDYLFEEVGVSPPLPTLLPGRRQVPTDVPKEIEKKKEHEKNKEAQTPKILLLNREQALALQQELMMAFNLPAFQRELHEIGREHERNSPGFRKAFMKLVRREQLDIIPRYGLKGSEEGVEQMLRSFQLLKDDADVQVNAAAINDLLEIDREQSIGADAPKRKSPIRNKPTQISQVRDMLKWMLKEFSKFTFQADIKDLKRCQDFNLKRTYNPRTECFEDPDGYYHLEGRPELVVMVTSTILPIYGFEPSNQGVQDMLQHCAPFFKDPELGLLLDQVNAKLGMSPAAVQRFHHVVLSLAE